MHELLIEAKNPETKERVLNVTTCVDKELYQEEVQNIIATLIKMDKIDQEKIALKDCIWVVNNEEFLFEE